MVGLVRGGGRWYDYIKGPAYVRPSRRGKGVKCGEVRVAVLR